MLMKLLILAAAGALGTLLRAGMTVAVHRRLGTLFPWGTVAVNALGCFGFGLVWALVEGRLRGAADLRLFVLTGFMGAFTTFSTYAFDTVMLLQSSRPLAAVGHLVLQNTAGLLAILGGLWLGRAT